MHIVQRSDWNARRRRMAELRRAEEIADASEKRGHDRAYADTADEAAKFTDFYRREKKAKPFYHRSESCMNIASSSRS